MHVDSHTEFFQTAPLPLEPLVQLDSKIVSTAKQFLQQVDTGKGAVT